MNSTADRAIKIGVALSMFAATAGLIGCAGDPATDAQVDPQALTNAQAVTGNGGPSGAHYNLNIIGVANPKTTDMTSNGGRIFVPLTGSTKINLSEGDFQVLDANGTDGTAAFQLPSPDPTNSGTTTYSVFARALGTPGGSSKQTTCATDPTTGQVYCSIYSSVQVRSTGKSSFTNVSKELLYVYADVNGDGTVERYPLFDSALQDYFWQYDNNGLKVLQLRFYQVPTTVP
ncbi:MAG TPA: hypothetical protein VN962_16660 [Polyangia bacterium]|nr:hypothetical protein [Polyangia bacterium]